MNLPFTLDQFLGVFKAYNLAIWPTQVIAYILGLAMIFLVIKKAKYSNQLIAGGLALMWLCAGLLYHISYFSTINKAAYIFGTVFIIQGLLFIIFGVLKSNITFELKANAYSFIGFLFILYAMVIYPILGYLLGHVYPQSPVFGVAPCPVTIFTFGILLLTDKLPRTTLIIPFIWSLFGFSAASTLGIREDIGLIIAGLVGSVLILYRGHKLDKETTLSR
ncbi:MAG: DUF6064 family protein [Candidatus Saccharibacteria bacterium]